MGQNESRKTFESKGTANYGVSYIADTSTHYGRWWQMQVIEDAVVTSFKADITDGDGNAITTFSGNPTFEAGTFIPMPYCTSITLASGKVFMHKAGKEA